MTEEERLSRIRALAHSGHGLALLHHPKCAATLAVVVSSRNLKEAADAIAVGLNAATSPDMRVFRDILERMEILTFASDANIAANAATLLRGAE